MGTFAHRLRSLLTWPSPSLIPNEPAHPFDRAHKVDTSGLYYADRLPTGHPHDQYSEGYYASAPSLFLGALAQWQATLPAAAGLPAADGLPGPGLRVADYTFVDLGCGKGRALLMASMYPFRAVRGIELNAKLVRVARRNLRKWTKGGRAVCADVQVICGDVLGPKHDPVLERVLDAGGPVVLFLFNSFAAEVLAGLMQKLAGAARPPRQTPIDLVYVHPEHDRLVAATPGIELLRHAEIPFTYEDVQADLFGVSSDISSVWRLGASYSSH
jgi:SAM-dependent methyltransferase